MQLDLPNANLCKLGPTHKWVGEQQTVTPLPADPSSYACWYLFFHARIDDYKQRDDKERPADAASDY